MRTKIIATAERIAEEATLSNKALMTRVLNNKANPQDFECYEQAVRRYSEQCFNLSEVRWKSYAEASAALFVRIRCNTFVQARRNPFHVQKDTFVKKMIFCSSQNEYALRHVYLLSNLCEEKVPISK